MSEKSQTPSLQSKTSNFPDPPVSIKWLIPNVSVLVCQSNVFESLMLYQLMEYIQGKLSDLLSAYRKGCSTQHVLMHAIEERKTAFDRGQHVGMVTMDLSKAFDAIPHGLPLAKLHL